MSSTGLAIWAFVFFLVYQLKNGLATPTGQRLLEALIERLRPKRE